MRKSEQSSRLYVATMPMGLDRVTCNELVHKLDLSRHAIETDSSRQLRFHFSGHPRKLLELRSVTDVWVVVREFAHIGPRAADLRSLARLLGMTRLDQSLATLHDVGLPLKRHMTFNAACSMRGRRSYRRVDALQTLEASVYEQSRGRLRPVRENADLRLWLDLWGDHVRLGLALTRKPLGQRNRQVSLPASLPGPVAYAMAVLTRPRPQQVFLDPMCGTGSIALERAENWRYGLLVLGDLDARAIEATRLNFGPRHKPRAFLRWDARALPLPDQSVDAIACNPPHGIQMMPGESLRPLYQRFLLEARRVLRHGALMTFLTPHRDMTDAILSNLSELHIKHCFVIDLLGQRPYLYVLKRS